MNMEVLDGNIAIATINISYGIYSESILEMIRFCIQVCQEFLKMTRLNKLLEKHRAFSADNPKTDTLGCGSFEGTFTTVDFFAASDSQINSSFRLQQNYSKGGL